MGLNAHTDTVIVALRVVLTPWQLVCVIYTATYDGARGTTLILCMPSPRLYGIDSTEEHELTDYTHHTPLRSPPSMPEETHLEHEPERHPFNPENTGDVAEPVTKVRGQ